MSDILPGDCCTSNVKVSIWDRCPNNEKNNNVQNILNPGEFFFVVCNVIALQRIKTLMVITQYGCGWIDIVPGVNFRKLCHE
jgi:hypothetical protein